MGAKYSICCCPYCVKHNRDEKNPILRMSTTTGSRLSGHLSSESSDSDQGEESLFGPELWRSPRNRQERQNGTERSTERSTEEPCTSSNRPQVSAVRRASDRQLQDFIRMRDRADEATEEWEKLNYDIHTLRYARRKVRSRWKKILLQLGYQLEADALLCVNAQNRLGQEQLCRAAELLEQLLQKTSLFLPGTGCSRRYTYVMDRLVSLDSAEDFVRLAQEKYPK